MNIAPPHHLVAPWAVVPSVPPPLINVKPFRTTPSLERANIDYIDVIVFSNKKDQVDDKESITLLDNDLMRLKNQFEEWNQQQYHSNFAKNFKG